MEEPSLKKIKLDISNTSNNNKNLPIYIHNDIIKAIIDYLLLNNNKRTYINNDSNNYIFKNYYININEIIQLSLVSKKWFNIISNFINDNIISNNILEKWFYLFSNKSLDKSLNEKYDNTDSDNKERYNLIGSKKCNMTINKEYSIIKINESIVNDYFNNQILQLDYDQESSLDHYNDILNLDQLENDGKLKFRKIVMNLDYNLEKFSNLFLKGGVAEGMKKNGILDISSNSNNNRIIELNIDGIAMNHYDTNSFYNRFFYNNQDGLDQDEFEKQRLQHRNPILYFNNIDFDGAQREYQEKTFKVLKYLKGKNISFYDHITSHADYSFVFDSKINNQVESIEIISDFVEPINLANVGQLDNLHSLSIQFQFHNMINILLNDPDTQSYCSDNHLIINRDNLIQDWNTMIQSLLSSKSIKNLSIAGCCDNTDCLDHSNDIKIEKENTLQIDKINQYKKVFSNGIKQLLSSKSTSIEYLKMENMFDLISFDTFSEINNNKSIKTLVLKETLNWYEQDQIESYSEQQFIILNYLFENVFTTGNNIKHFKFTLNSKLKVMNIFESLCKYYKQIQLYSITINVKAPFFNDVIDEIINLSMKISKNQKDEQEEEQLFINLKEFKIKIYECYRNYRGRVRHINQYQSILNSKTTEPYTRQFVTTICKQFF